MKNIKIKNGKKVNKTGYILKTDATRNNIIPRDLSINDDIPGQYYGIEIIEDPGVNAVSISLILYSEIDYSLEEKLYKNIEITRYLLDSQIID